MDRVSYCSGVSMYIFIVKCNYIIKVYLYYLSDFISDQKRKSGDGGRKQHEIDM